MSIVDNQFRTITCNGAGCEKTITFNAEKASAQQAEEENPWLKNCRIVSVPGKQPFVYCSDSCEVSGVTTGQHNPVTRPTLVPGNQASIRAAAEAAALAEQATKSLKAGPAIHP